jgi:hypothetical protein
VKFVKFEEKDSLKEKSQTIQLSFPFLKRLKRVSWVWKWEKTETKSYLFSRAMSKEEVNKKKFSWKEFPLRENDEGNSIGKSEEVKLILTAGRWSCFEKKTKFFFSRNKNHKTRKLCFAFKISFFSSSSSFALLFFFHKTRKSEDKNIRQKKAMSFVVKFVSFTKSM